MKAVQTLFQINTTHPYNLKRDFSLQYKNKKTDSEKKVRNTTLSGPFIHNWRILRFRVQYMYLLPYFSNFAVLTR